MGDSNFEYDRNRFSLSERLIIELFPLSYIFVFFLGEGFSIIPYAWFLISVLGGIVSYFIFLNRDYTLSYGIVLALLILTPLVLLGITMLTFFVIFVYVLWRIQSNFNGSRINGWPFKLVNTLVFISVTFLARLIFPFQEPELLMQKQLSLYLMTSVLYYFVRMLTITVNSKQLGNFLLKDAWKLVSVIISTGLMVFGIVLMVLKPVRLGIFYMFGFLLNGLFILFGEISEPLLEYFKQGAEKFMEEEMTEMKGETEKIVLPTYGYEGLSSFETLSITIVMLLLIGVAVILIRRKRQSRHNDKLEDFSFFFKGKRMDQDLVHSLSYDYSEAQDEVRKSFELFEKYAQDFSYTRPHGESIIEWFSRMGWSKDNRAITIYNEVRYGLHIPTENELQVFKSELEKIKEKFFVKEV